MLAAKMLATIDVLANGRLIIGAGAGWMKEEFALLDVPFEVRGKLTDEYLEAFRELWTKDTPSFKASTCASPTCCSIPSLCRSRIRRFGSAARARPRCVARSSSPMPGIPATTARPSRSIRPRASAPALPTCGGCAEAAGRDPATLGMALLVQGFFEWGRTRPRTAGAAPFHRQSADMAADAAVALRRGGWPRGAAAGRDIDRGSRRAHRALRPRGDREGDLAGVGDADTKLLVVIPGLVPGNMRRALPLLVFSTVPLPKVFATLPRLVQSVHQNAEARAHQCSALPPGKPGSTLLPSPALLMISVVSSLVSPSSSLSRTCTR